MAKRDRKAEHKPSAKRTGEAQTEIPLDQAEQAKRFLESEEGQEFIRSYQQLQEANAKLKDFVIRLRNRMRTDSNDTRQLYGKVGEFVVRFSQIEFMLRIMFAHEAALDGKRASTIASQLEFRSLAKILNDLFKEKWGKRRRWKTVAKIFNECEELNIVRNKIVHGSWMASTKSLGSLYLSRQSRQWEEHIRGLKDASNEIARLERVESAVMSLMAGEFEPDPLDDDDC